MNISIDPMLQSILYERGIESVVYDRILSKSEKQNMLENLEVFASSWFIENGKDISEYRDVSIGAAIHDDVLTFFSSLYHILLLVEKLDYKKNKIVFYQSKSCELPESIKKTLLEIGITVETTIDRYPFPCYKKAFEKSGYSRMTYTGIVYDGYSKTKYISCIRPGIRSLIYKIIFNIVNSLYLPSSKIIYLRTMRRLQPMFNNFVNNCHKDSEIQLKVAFPETYLGDLVNSLNYLNLLRLIRQLVKLAKNGIFIKHSIYMIAPRNGILKNYSSQDEKERQIQLIENSKGSIENLIGFNNIEIYNLFFGEFMRFYSHHFNKFIRLIDKLHLEVKENKINNYLVEHINPFMGQVIANHGKNIYFIHLSRWINNQYFCKPFINKVKNRFFILVTSKFEHDRIMKNGFDEDRIIKVRESYFDNGTVKNNNLFNSTEKEYSLEEKSVLVITPPLAVLWTYRSLLDSTFFMNFISDIVSTLELFKVSKIIIRPTLGTHEINRMNFTISDIYAHMFRNIKKEKCSYIIRNENNLVNIEEDLHKSDLVIGTLSACAIDAAMAGLDYIAYDNSIFPFPDSLNLSIFSNKGPIPMASNKVELKNLLSSYKPNQGGKVIDYIRPFKESSDIIGSLDDINTSSLYNFE